jgi:small subunit ribosomal protein S5
MTEEKKQEANKTKGVEQEVKEELKEEVKEVEEVKETVVVEEVKEIEKVPVPEVVPEIIAVRPPLSLEKWVPKTSLGKKVFSGEIADIETVLNMGVQIREPEIIDKLVPEMKNEIILIGGRTGKGGGVQRIPVKITAKMHRSGRRLAMSAFVVVGNENGIVGVGKGNAIEARDAIAKAIQRAKMNIIRLKRGCGSWECRCGTEHSVAFKTKGKGGSVRVELLPAPKGIGLVADDETKKILRLAGIHDVWVRTFGNTSARINLITAVYDALKKLYIYEKIAEGTPRKKVIEEAEDLAEEEEDLEESEENEEGNYYEEVESENEYEDGESEESEEETIQTREEETSKVEKEKEKEEEEKE